jgi:hypothetical protein
MLKSVAAIAFTFILAAASPAFSDSKLAELDAYQVSAEEHRFEQVMLTPDLVTRTIAATSGILNAQMDMGRQVHEIMQSSRSSWDKAVERTKVIQASNNRIEELAKTAGFDDIHQFFRTLTTLQLVMMRDTLRTNTARQVEIATYLQNTGLPERFMVAPTLRHIEMTISAAQQQALPENVTVAEPFRARFMEGLRELGRR